MNFLETEQLDKDTQQIHVQLSYDELLIIKYALHEIIRGVEEWEFHTLTGAYKSEAVSLVRDISKAFGIFRDSTDSGIKDQE